MSLESLISRMNVLAKTNRMEKAVAVAMLQKTSERIFTEGKAANDASIGRYSDSYMKLRKKVGYPSSTNVVLQGLDRRPKGTRANPNKRGTTKYFSTKQMVHDWKVIVNGKSLGLGFKNGFNADKSNWVEETYNKAIFSHTANELALIDQLLNEGVNKILNG
jgi:hypothetical protein